MRSPRSPQRARLRLVVHADHQTVRVVGEVRGRDAELAPLQECEHRRPLTPVLGRGLEAHERRRRVRIGIPRVLNLYSTGPYFRTYFEALGMPKQNVVFSDDTSLIFKETKIHRFYDRKRNVLVYLAISRKLIEGAPANAISTVPVQPWGGK